MNQKTQSQDSSKPSFKSLVELGLDPLMEMARKYARAEKSIKEKQKEFKGNTSEIGKVIAALMVIYSGLQDKGALPKGTSFSEYHENVIGTAPNTHALQCAKTFNGFVQTGLITEGDYDDCAGDWLSRCSEILTLAKNDLANPVVLKAAAILKRRPNEGAKQLRQIKAELKGETSVGSADGKGTPLTAAVFITILRQAFNMNLQGFCTAELVAEIMHAKTRSVEIQEALYNACIDMTDAWGNSGVEFDTLETWGKDRDARNRPVQIIKAEVTADLSAPLALPEIAAEVLPVEIPVETYVSAEQWARANYKGFSDEEIAYVVEGVTEFVTGKGRFPADTAEMDNFASAPAMAA